MMGDLTPDFSAWEFAPASWPMYRRKEWGPTTSQWLMLESLTKEVLQPTRDQFGRIEITSGARTLADYRRLIGNGYHPSWRSDHFFGLPVPTADGFLDEFGPSYIFSVGAADIVPRGTQKPSTRAVFDWMAAELPPASFGQIIYETHQRADGSEARWIHASNPKSVVFSAQIARKVAKPMRIGVGQNGVYALLERG